MRNIFVILILFLISIGTMESKSLRDSLILSIEQQADSNNLFRGLILNKDTKEILPYASVYVLNKDIGTISNEIGHFTLNLSYLEENDTLRVQYIGFTTLNICLNQIDSTSTIYLKEEIFNLNETVIFGSAPSAESIVKKVLINKDSNYRKTYGKQQTFIRKRDIANVDDIKLIYKKSSISELNREMIQKAENQMPRNSTSYTDFLGYIYISGDKDDSIKLKTEPIRTVSLKEEDLAEVEQLIETFEGIFINIDSNEYWKVKSGIFSEKIDQEEFNSEREKDTLEGNERKLSSFSRSTHSRLRYTSLDDDREWEFLHKTAKYNYTLVGGTRVGGEDVYIIDFAPKKGGNFLGRMYISLETYALIRADYEFAPEKTGTNIHLFGVGYTETQFKGSIYFEKKNDNYVLKYFSKKEAAIASIDRSISLIKKRERLLFDKKISEIKVRLQLEVTNEESVELLVLNEEDISKQQYSDFTQEKIMKIIYVDQFDENLWKGYSIIEPTEQMKEYKKSKSDSY